VIYIDSQSQSLSGSFYVRKLVHIMGEISQSSVTFKWNHKYFNGFICDSTQNFISWDVYSHSESDMTVNGCTINKFHIYINGRD